MTFEMINCGLCNLDTMYAMDVRCLTLIAEPRHRLSRVVSCLKMMWIFFVLSIFLSLLTSIAGKWLNFHIEILAITYIRSMVPIFCTQYATIAEIMNVLMDKILKIHLLSLQLLRFCT